MAEKKAGAKAPKSTKSAGEAEALPAASSPAVTGEAVSQQDETTLSTTQAAEVADGDFGPFQDNAPPVGPALDATRETVNTKADFDEKDVPITVSKGDVVVAVRVHNNRNIVEIAPQGWTGPGQIFAPYQVELLIQALREVKSHLR